MFELTVERLFSAAHQVRVAGEMETVHGHDWRVRVSVAGPALDGDGLLCDFHAVERALDAAIAPWRNGNLNAVPPFGQAFLPTAEHVALAVARAVAPALTPGVQLARVCVREAPGCEATYRPVPAPTAPTT